MTPPAFRARLSTLGLSQTALANLTEHSDRQVRRWASGERPVPRWVAMLLSLLTADVLRRWLERGEHETGE